MTKLTIKISEERYQALKETADRERKNFDDIIDDSLELFGIKSEVPLLASDKPDRQNKANNKIIQPDLSTNKTNKVSSIEPPNKFNGWGADIIKTFILPVRYFYKALSEHILPAFNNLEVEIENKYLTEVTSDIYDDTEYSYMMYMRQSMINLHAVGLRHLYEQQFSYLVMRLLENYERQAVYIKDEKVIIDLGEIDIKYFRSWKKLEELYYLCNAIKHAQGTGAIKLNKARPDLFEPPSLLIKWCDVRPSWDFSTKPFPVHNPLAGEDIYLTEKDVKDYSLAIEDFWNEFISVLNNYNNSN
ncbi:MAG: hypothetical protein WCI11_01835 [Candidatus Methylumidiphilus sp.]